MCFSFVGAEPGPPGAGRGAAVRSLPLPNWPEHDKRPPPESAGVRTFEERITATKPSLSLIAPTRRLGSGGGLVDTPSSRLGFGQPGTAALAGGQGWPASRA